MTNKRALSDRMIGIISLITGSLAIWQGVDFLPYRQSPLMGDHVMLFFIGGMQIILGVLVGFVVNYPAVKVKQTEKSVQKKIHATLFILAAFLIANWLLGYLAALFLMMILLFRIFGSYAWVKCALLSAAFTILIYMVFIALVEIPFSTGLLIETIRGY